MKTGLILLVTGVVVFLYAYFRYKKEQQNLALVKEQDLIAYYLDLAFNLLPIPFWSAIIGLLLVIIAVIVILVNIPVVF